MTLADVVRDYLASVDVVAEHDRVIAYALIMWADEIRRRYEPPAPPCEVVLRLEGGRQAFSGVVAMAPARGGLYGAEDDSEVAPSRRPR